jgi:alpha-tubulin suppressor-like RCC1 family protein
LNLTGSQVYTWGRKDYGQLGHGEANRDADAGEFVSTPTLVKFPALDGPKVHLFTDIACGDHTSMALTVDHDLYTWGFEATTGHAKYHNTDLGLPMKLNVNISLQKRDNTSTAVVYKIACGGQHAAVLVKRFAANNSNLI